MSFEKNQIIKKDELAATVSRHVIYAPLIAAKAKAGQYVILRAREGGERIPITIADWDAKEGTITIFVQSIGKSTACFNSLRAGDKFLNVAGPLGVPAEIKNYGLAVCVGGGVGIAEVLPIAKALRAAGNKVTAILGARTKDLLILDKEMAGAADEVKLTTDDGSYGAKGLVTDSLAGIYASGQTPGAVFVIGPIPMMRAVAAATLPAKTPTFASLNPILLDATGMCGCCRVEVGGQTKFACVDGPIFDAHQVNFALLSVRTAAYREQEKKSFDLYRQTAHDCRLDQALSGH